MHWLTRLRPWSVSFCSGNRIVGQSVTDLMTKFTFVPQRNCQSMKLKTKENSAKSHTIQGTTYEADELTNTSDRIVAHIGQNLHLQQYHPLNHIKQRITKFMYSRFVNNRGSPRFSVYDNIHPVVTTEQNFTSLLIPNDHPSRSKSDTYYLNSKNVLRTHTSAHQRDLIRCGLDNFLVVGDVYRKDQIDASHYSVFHQVEAVRLVNQHELFREKKNYDGLKLFEEGKRTCDHQQEHSLEAVKLMEYELKNCLVNMVQHLFGRKVEYRWVDAYFPFTHPSYELEINLNGKWLEILGCGIMEHQILVNAGAGDKIGWAFGLGLERLAMKLYSIPDIRLFWSRDTGFLSQFKVENPFTVIKYKPISGYPQCLNDLAFWVPDDFSSNDFYELVRKVGGDIVEQVAVVDEFFHPTHKKKSHCYRITYRHMEKTLTQAEVNVIHSNISKAAVRELNVTLR